MNRNVRCTKFFLRYVPALARHGPHSPPLEIIITVCHEKGRHPLNPNHDVLFEPPLSERFMLRKIGCRKFELVILPFFGHWLVTSHYFASCIFGGGIQKGAGFIFKGRGRQSKMKLCFWLYFCKPFWENNFGNFSTYFQRRNIQLIVVTGGQALDKFICWWDFCLPIFLLFQFISYVQ